MNIKEIKGLIQSGFDWSIENMEDFPEKYQELFIYKLLIYTSFMITKAFGSDEYVKAMIEIFDEREQGDSELAKAMKSMLGISEIEFSSPAVDDRAYH